MPTSSSEPVLHSDPGQPGRLRLEGGWTLQHTALIGRALQQAPDQVEAIDASGVERLDTVGVLRLIRFARKHGLELSAIEFRQDHHALVSAIEDVQDDRPPHAREYGFAAALARLGASVHGKAKEASTLVGFLGENLVKLARLAKEPSRLRVTSTVHHMEEVGLNAVPLVILLSYLVGAVIAFLGAAILSDFGAEIFVVELVSIAFLREFGVLLTAIILAGRTASAFTAQIGAMVSREEVDAIRTLGLDPIDLLVLPRTIALMVMLPLLTFLAMIAGLAGGLSVGAFSLEIPPQAYLARMQDTFQMRHMLVGLAKAPLFALLIALIGCLEGLKVTGTAQSVGERTTASVVQAISLVIVIDAFAAIWFMHMGW